MATRATSADISYQIKNLQREFDALGLPSANLTVQEGSKTYGRAFRLFYRDPQTGGLSSVGPMRSDYLGMTKGEAVDALKFIIDGLRIARDARGPLEAEKALAAQKAGLGVGHVWTATQCPAYRSYAPSDCTCNA